MTNDSHTKRVRQYMSKDVVTAYADSTVHEALALMAENRISALPVVDKQDRCVGILSTSDLVDFTLELDDGVEDLMVEESLSHDRLVERFAEGSGHQNIADLMTETVASIDPEALLPFAAREMLRHRVHRLPVVDRNGKLLGILSTLDVLAAFAEDAP